MDGTSAGATFASMHSAPAAPTACACRINDTIPVSTRARPENAATYCPSSPGLASTSSTASTCGYASTSRATSGRGRLYPARKELFATITGQSTASMSVR